MATGHEKRCPQCTKILKAYGLKIDLPQIQPTKSWTMKSGKGGGKLKIYTYRCVVCGEKWKQLETEP